MTTQLNLVSTLIMALQERTEMRNHVNVIVIEGFYDCKLMYFSICRWRLEKNDLTEKKT